MKGDTIGFQESLVSSSYFKDLKENTWNFILSNCCWEVSFINTVLSLLLSEGLDSEKKHMLFPASDGNTGTAPLCCCKSRISSDVCGIKPVCMS